MSTEKKKPSYKELHGATWAGDALRKLKDVAPEILSFAQKVTGVPGLEFLGSLIEGTDTITKEDKEVVLKELEKDIALEREMTKRWEADMSSDSWLSKNIRPMGLGWAFIMITALLIISWCGIKTPESVIYLFSGTATTILGGYYVLRTVEKRNEKKYK